MAALIRGYLDYGPYGDNLLFGAPFGLNTGWASTVDDVHIWLMSSLGLVISDPLTIMAIYFFLCFPAAALTMYGLCRRYGTTRPAAILSGVLFSIVPGHQERFPHLFLAAYWAIPISVWLILESSMGRSILTSHRRHGKGSASRSKLRLIAVITMLLALGLGDIYYTAFTLVIAVPVIVIRQLRNRDFGEFGRLMLPVLVLVTPALVSLAMARARAARDEISGGMAFSRSVADSERWSGRLMDLILPWEGHRFPPFSFLPEAYNVLTATHGEVSAIGLVALGGVVGAVLYVSSALLKQQWSKLPPLLVGIVLVILITAAFYTKGGLGSWVAFFFTPQIRTWSRLFIFVAAVGYITVAIWVSSIGRRHGRRLGWGVAVSLLIVGVWDQTNPGRAPDYTALRARHVQLADFSRTLAAKLGNGCQIFNLPVVQFPEVNDPSVADNFSLGVASENLRWSFGAISGTRAADWQLGLSKSNADRLLDDVAAVGFCGVVVHRSLEGTDPQLPKAITAALGAPIARTNDGLYTAFDLRGRRAALDGKFGAAGRVRRAWLALHPVVVSVSGSMPIFSEGGPHLALGPRPKLQISNMSGRTVALRINVTVASPSEISRDYQLSGLGRTSNVALAAKGHPAYLALSVVAQPGNSSIDIGTPNVDVGVSTFHDWETLPYVSELVASAGADTVNVGVSWPRP